MLGYEISGIFKGTKKNIMCKINQFSKIIALIVVLFFGANLYAQVGIGLTNPTAQLTVNQGAIFNESGGDFDFRIESLNRVNMLFIDASTNRIGINTNTPANVIDFRTTNENIFLTNWLNNHATNGALARFEHTNAANPNRVLLSTTNYNGNGFETQGLMGLAVNPSNSGGPPGAALHNVRGVTGFNNNENGIGIYGGIAFAGGYAGYAGYFNADIYIGGGIFGPSDARLKRDINSFNALSKINNINPVSYYYDTDKYPGIYEPDKLAYGFLAQEIELIIPEMVKDSEIVINSNKVKNAELSSKFESEKFKTVNYMTMIPILTQGIKEQQSIIENQNARIETLEKKLIILESKVNQILKTEN